MSEIIDATIAPVMPEIRLDVLDPVVIQGHLQPAVPMGSSGSSGFTWNQAIPLTVWTVPHNLGRYPSVTVVNTSGQRVEPDVTYQDSNIVQITHGAAFAGKAYLN